ncbi:hypothetical protein [Nitrospira sp. KM1]|uniref:hypothetical protein n=1 Tax=Nitrospira sp. KM1 TaxID=1936990 RepID=UPI0015676DFC|nr:hypothetical protein [Nitrospira sp. KM1]
MSDPRSVQAADNAVFSQFAAHIIRHVNRDKIAFTEASTCLSWFYQGLKKSPPAVQGIAWTPAASTGEPGTDCSRRYPGGMNAARDDFSKTQAILSVSLTIYEFALVADSNDDRIYSPAELMDLFRSLSLTVDEEASPGSSLSTLTERMERWHRTRNLEEVMTGMGALYDRGYRVTVSDRAELDRVMK